MTFWGSGYNAIEKLTDNSGGWRNRGQRNSNRIWLTAICNDHGGMGGSPSGNIKERTCPLGKKSRKWVAPFPWWFTCPICFCVNDGCVILRIYGGWWILSIQLHHVMGHIILEHAPFSPHRDLWTPLTATQTHIGIFCSDTQMFFPYA